MDIERYNYLNEIIKFLDKPFIKILVGMRRTGKSKILFSLIDYLKETGVSENNIIYLDFENFENEYINSAHILNEEIIKRANNSEKFYLIFDEIQHVNEWEKVISSYASKSNFDIFITGSDAKVLSSELSTKIAGRYKTFNIFPFNFNELLQFNDVNKTGKTETKIFEEYLNYGSIPQIQYLDNETKISSLKDLYNSILLKDVIQRNNVKNINLLCKISNFVVDSSAKIISTNKIITALNSGNKVVRNEDVYNFISYITNSFFINECLRFDIKGKQVLKTLSKFYLTDVGFRRTIFSPNEQFGRQLENIIFNEIKILGYDINIGVTSDGKEIDFIVSDGNKRWYIQVAYKLPDEETIVRETSSLANTQDSFKKILITTEPEFSLDNGIEHINALAFLKNIKKYLS